jgi:Mg-chelatase subunit ChlD
LGNRPTKREIEEIKGRLDALEGKGNKKKSLIHIVLDRSGSMESIWSDVKGGFDRFIEEQKQFDADVTLTYFDDAFGTAFVNSPIKNVKKLNSYKEITPRGSTALYDAVGMSIQSVKDKASNYDKIVFVVYTDGMENASKEFDSKKVKNLITKFRDKWQFIYLGSNQDAWAVGTGLGFYGQSTLTYAANSAGVGSSTRSMSNSVGAYLGGTADSVVLDPDAEATPVNP